MKRKLLLGLALLAGFYGQAQGPLASATLDMTLQCSGGSSARTGLGYNPNQELYYSVNGGTTGNPIETFDNTGTPVLSNSQGFDYRGIWWNPNTDELEGNGYNNLGIWIQDLDANFYALGTGTNDISGASGADAQSCADYDPNADEIIIYDNGNIYTYDRATYSLNTTTAITGLPAAVSNLNNYCVGYTGVTGMEVGVYDYVNKAYYFIDKATGAYVTTCQLPAGAPGPSSYQVAFANDRVWLYDTGASQWKGYIVIEQCSETTASRTEVVCGSYTVPSGDETHMATGTYYDTIPNAQGCDSVLTIDLTVNTVDTSTSVSALDIMSNASGASYQWIDCGNGNSVISGETGQTYSATANGSYAVIVTENGCTDTSDCVDITTVGLDEVNLNNISLYPNPTAGVTTIQLGDLNNVTIEVRSISGRLITKEEGINADTHKLELTNTPNGVYIVNVNNQDFERNFKLIIKH